VTRFSTPPLHPIAQFEEKTEADARAKMLIYLLENKLIKIFG